MTTSIQTFSDPNLDWMNAYETVGDDRWAMSMIVFDTDGRILKLEKQVDPSQASRLLVETIAELRSSAKK